MELRALPSVLDIRSLRLCMLASNWAQKVGNSKTFPENCGSFISGSLPFPALTAGLQESSLHIPQQLKDCRTTLIPKTDDPRPDAEDYRPITVASCLYRLFSIIETRRLEDSLSLHPRQKAFRSGTDGAFDNTSTLMTVIREAHNCGKELNIVSIDLVKAFDTVNHTSITRALRMHGLDDESRTLITEMVTGSSTIIKGDGGALSNRIEINQGVRQGDPISPLPSSGSDGAQRLVTTNADENHSEGLSEQNEAGEDFTSERLGTTPLPPRSWVHNDVPYYTLPLLSSPVALLKYGSGRYPGCTANFPKTFRKADRTESDDRVSSLAFADDIILLLESKPGPPSQIPNDIRILYEKGLGLSLGKCFDGFGGAVFDMNGSTGFLLSQSAI
ncbi:Retrovirus-related Pol polyprotein from type-1 retrotransposable element [Trichinella sp. T8]|nr:Retrovirus-related Pol polyprotein from type-1 retrotransposable element [Trichinella sp. T8]